MVSFHPSSLLSTPNRGLRSQRLSILRGVLESQKRKSTAAKAFVCWLNRPSQTRRMMSEYPLRKLVVPANLLIDYHQSSYFSRIAPFVSLLSAHYPSASGELPLSAPLQFSWTFRHTLIDDRRVRHSKLADDVVENLSTNIRQLAYQLQLRAVINGRRSGGKVVPAADESGTQTDDCVDWNCKYEMRWDSGIVTGSQSSAPSWEGGVRFEPRDGSSFKPSQDRIRAIASQLSSQPVMSHSSVAYLRKEFLTAAISPPLRVARARLYVTAVYLSLGSLAEHVDAAVEYIPYLNGKDLRGDEHGHSGERRWNIERDQRWFYHTYDVKPYIDDDGWNCVAVAAGLRSSASVKDRTLAIAALLVITHASGRTTVIKTDETWLCTNRTPVSLSGGGEVFDARETIFGWNYGEFDDGSSPDDSSAEMTPEAKSEESEPRSTSPSTKPSTKEDPREGDQHPEESPAAKNSK
ncbi:hypothetical protein HDU93_003375, partial [Gonapodya sp. JEL0774]